MKEFLNRYGYPILFVFLIIRSFKGCEDVSFLKKQNEYQQLSTRIIEKRLDSLFYEFADDCTWIELDKTQLQSLGIPLVRRSDRRPVEVVRIYSCQNYKDY